MTVLFQLAVAIDGHSIAAFCNYFYLLVEFRRV